MKDFLTPDYMFESYRAITPEFLRSIGVRALLIDIDNTLAPYEVEDADDATVAWFEELRANGIVVALVSNNHASRVERFNQRLSLPAYADSKKPGKKTLLLAMERLGASKEESAMLGDQLLTDAYAGKHLGLRALIVPPIKDKTNLFFKFKRFCERPFIRKYAKTHGYAAYMQFWHIKPVKKKEEN